MSPPEQRSAVEIPARLAGYRLRRSMLATARGRVHVKAALAVGGLGVQLDLDSVPGVVWAEVWDHGGRVPMPPAHVHVEVWGGDIAEVAATLEQAKPVGVLVTLRVHPPNLWRRFLRWVRFTAWCLETRIGGLFRG